MAGRKAGSPSRSEFIRKILASKPDSKLSEINEAWKKAGHSGEVTATLFYQVKSKAGSGNTVVGRRGRPPKSASIVVAKSQSSGTLGLLQAVATFVGVAGSIDNAIATLEAARSFGK